VKSAWSEPKRGGQLLARLKAENAKPARENRVVGPLEPECPRIRQQLSGLGFNSARSCPRVLLLEGLVQKRCGLFHAELASPADERSATGGLS